MRHPEIAIGNKLYTKLKDGEISIEDISDEDLPKVRRSTATMSHMTHASNIMADIVAEELAYRRSLKDQDSREKSSKAMESLTRALIGVGIVQAVIYFGQLMVLIFGKKLGLS